MRQRWRYVMRGRERCALYSMREQMRAAIIFDYSAAPRPFTDMSLRYLRFSSSRAAADACHAFAAHYLGRLMLDAGEGRVA